MQMTYCKAGETVGYQSVLVFDLETGREIGDVAEVDTKAGWLERYKRVGSAFAAENGVATLERLSGRFELRPLHTGERP